MTKTTARLALSMLTGPQWHAIYAALDQYVGNEQQAEDECECYQSEHLVFAREVQEAMDEALCSLAA